MLTATLYQQTADQELKRLAYLSSAGFCSKVIWRLLKNERTLQERAIITGVPYRPSSWEEFKELLENSGGYRPDHCLKHPETKPASPRAAGLDA